LRRYESCGNKKIHCGFDRLDCLDPAVRAIWRSIDGQHAHKQFSWDQPAVEDPSVSSPWEELHELRLRNRAGWERLARVEDTETLPWLGWAPNDRKQTTPWDELPGKDIDRVAPYIAPPANDLDRILSWNELPVKEAERVLPYGAPPPNDEHHRTLWGKKYYEEICQRRYEPPAGDQIILNFDQPIAGVGGGDHIDFYFETLNYDQRCRHREHSGWRDQYIFTRPPVIPGAPVQRVYIIMNNALLSRLPGHEPIDVSTMRLTADLDSWCWGLEATVNSRAALDMVAPDGSGPVSVEVEINGWRWVVMVESWRESKQFGRASWTINGRSESAQLAAPYAPSRSYTEENDRTAVQLVEAELLNTGWSVDWQQVGWLVTAGAWSYQNLTPMQAILRVAKSAGGVVLTDAEDKTLIVQPRYPSSPWNWDVATPDLIIPDAMIRDLGRDWRPGPNYNAVYVSGTNQGVTVRVYREGSVGDALAPSMADSLITEVAVGRERGRNILAAAGNWDLCRISVPLMAEPDLPGLILPGALLEINESGIPWRGQVMGVSISAARNNGLRVAQGLEVACYHG